VTPCFIFDPFVVSDTDYTEGERHVAGPLCSVAPKICHTPNIKGSKCLNCSLNFTTFYAGFPVERFQSDYCRSGIVLVSLLHPLHLRSLMLNYLRLQFILHKCHHSSETYMYKHSKCKIHSLYS